MNGAERYAAGIDLLQGGTAALTAGVRELDQHSAPLNTGVMMLTRKERTVTWTPQKTQITEFLPMRRNIRSIRGADILAEKTKDLPGLIGTLSDTSWRRLQRGRRTALDADSGAVAQINAALDQISTEPTRGWNPGLQQ